MKRAQLFAALASVALLLVAIAFSCFVSIGTFRQGHIGALMNSFAVAGVKAARNIEQALAYGKPLNDFYGIERYLLQVKRSLPDVRRVTVSLPDGRIIYDERGAASGQLAPSQRRLVQRELGARAQTYVFEPDSDTYVIFIPIRAEAGGPLQAALGISVRASALHDTTSGFADAFLRKSLLIALLGGLVLLGMELLVSRAGLSPARQRASALLVIALVQVAMGFYSYDACRDAYLESTRRTTAVVADLLKADIDGLVDKGVKFRQMHGVEAYLAGVQATVAHIGKIELVPASRAQLESEAVITPLATDADGIAHILELTPSQAYIDARLRDVVLDAATILLTSLMFMFEVSIMFAGGRSNAPALAAPPAVQRECSRFLAFLMYFGLFMPASFLPTIMGGFDEGLLGLSDSALAAAPISVEMAAGGVALLMVGPLVRRLGWVRVAYAGAGVMVLGVLLAWLAPLAAVFLLARGLTGAGAMSLLVSIYGLIDSIHDVDERRIAKPEMLAGMYAGVNCGAVTGALLAAQVGFRPVFLVSAAVLLLALGYIRFEIPRALRGFLSAPLAATAPAEAALPGRAADRVFILFFLMVTIPVTAATMFLPYFFPLFAAGLGEGSNVVARAFLLNGVCFVFLGPWLSRLVVRHVPMLVAVGLAAALLALGLLAFSWQGTLVFAFVAVVLIGVSDSVGAPAQSNYLTALPIAERLGRPAMQAYELTARKIGQVLGPFAFAFATVAGNQGVGRLATVTLLSVAAFMALAAVGARSTRGRRGGTTSL